MQNAVKRNAAPRTVAGLHEEIFLGSFPNREALEAQVDFWDASTASWYAWCPRLAQYSHVLNLREAETGLPLLVGQAIHMGMDVLYTAADPDLALQTVIETFGDHSPLPGAKYAHLDSGFVEGVFKNYLVWRKKNDAFQPLIVDLEDLDHSQVVAAIWRLLPDGRVVLGESKLVMEFEVDGEAFVYCGKPDLPVELNGEIIAFDHKVACGGYLSDWYFDKHVISNQLRGYCKMLSVLLGKHVSSALINGIWAGEKALAKDTKATKFMRYPLPQFSPEHLDEAIWNQYAWKQLAYIYQELGRQHPRMYQRFGYPQNTGKSCQGCSFLGLCKTDPRDRVAEMRRTFTQRRRSFLDL